MHGALLQTFKEINVLHRLAHVGTERNKKRTYKCVGTSTHFSQPVHQQQQQQNKGNKTMQNKTKQKTSAVSIEGVIVAFIVYVVD